MPLTAEQRTRFVSFMGVATVKARSDLNAVVALVWSKEHYRSPFLDFLDVVEVGICQDLLAGMNEVSNKFATGGDTSDLLATNPEATMALGLCLFTLQWDIDWDRYVSILALSAPARLQFLETVFDMSKESRRDVFKTSRECGMPVEMLLGLLGTQGDAPRCPMCISRKNVAVEVSRIHNLQDKAAAKKYGRETSVYEHDLLDKRSAMTDPLHDDLLRREYVYPKPATPPQDDSHKKPVHENYFGGVDVNLPPSQQHQQQQQHQLSALEKALQELEDHANKPHPTPYPAPDAHLLLEIVERPLVNAASRAYTVDTKILCAGCKVSVYRVALMSSDDTPIHHLLYDVKHDMLRQRRDQSVLKGRWWNEEKREADFKATVDAIVQANHSTKIRKRDERKKRESAAERARLAALHAAQEKAHSDMVNEALEDDVRWKSQHQQSLMKSLSTTSLLAALSFETSYGVHEPAQKGRKNLRSTKRAEYHDESGIPLTAASAAVKFGTAHDVVEDESMKLNEWVGDLSETKAKLDWRKEEQRRQREASERVNFDLNKEKWLVDAQVVQDKITGKYNRQAFIRTEKIKKRDEEKRINNLLRKAMREESDRRYAEAMEAENARMRRKAEEEAVELAERKRMSVAEAEQTYVDRFWGFPTTAEWNRREEERRRREYERRLIDKRAMMAAVGGEISVSKKVALGAADVLGIDIMKMKTMHITPMELASDPLGKRRRPIGQR